MTAYEFAKLVNGESRGRDRWIAHCPAHKDDSPSLSIRSGYDNRVLLRCFAGCTVESVLASLKLQWRDLFAGPPPSPEALAGLRAKHAASEAKRLRLMAARISTLRKLERAQMIVNALGAKLAGEPEDGTLAEEFHEACLLLNHVQIAVDGLKYSI